MMVLEITRYRQIEFDYDSQGRLTNIQTCYISTISSCGDPETVSLSYSNNNNTVTEEYSSYYEGDLESYGTTVWQLDNNGNITSAIDQNFYSNGDGTFDQDDVNISFEHDNFNSPFSNIAGVDANGSSSTI